MDPAIKLENVRKGYRDKFLRPLKALMDVSLVVQSGEAFGFVGPNGAGKSTTIKILTGIIRADVGEAKIFGVPVTDHRSRKGVAYVPENLYLYDYLTPLEVLKMGVRLHGLSVDNLDSHCMSWLERFDIAHVAKKKIRTFSKGMTQRTALAHALACKPKLLILDEPLSGLDPIGRKDVVDVLLEFRDQGGTVFFSSHVLNDVQRLGDRFGIIHRGVLRSVNTPAELAGGSEHSMVIHTRGKEEVAGLTRDGPSSWHIEVEEAVFLEHLKRLKEAGHQIIEVSRGVTLEQAFLRFIRDAEGGDMPQHATDY